MYVCNISKCTFCVINNETSGQVWFTDVKHFKRFHSLVLLLVLDDVRQSEYFELGFIEIVIFVRPM